MAIRKANPRHWRKLVEQGIADRVKQFGFSPGEAAAELGISRQAVHKAIRRGDLDAFIIERDDGSFEGFLVPDSSLEAFRSLREQRLLAQLEASRKHG